jgi:hypothetical protein
MRFAVGFDIQLKKQKMLSQKQKFSTILVELFVACLISFFWVRFYRYQYNIAFFNSPMINWWAFLLWSTGLFITMRTYRWLQSVVTPWGVRLLVLWGAYFSVLLFIEYLGYHIFKIREMTSGKPLCFGLIHGTPILKMYYLTAGIIAIFLSNIFKQALQAISFSAKEQGSETLET